MTGPAPAGVAGLPSGGVTAGLRDTPGDRPALLSGATGVLSYAELRDLTGAAAAALPVPPGGLVTLLGDRDLATVVGYLACLTTGRTGALVDAAAPAEVQRAQLAAFRPDAVLCAPRLTGVPTGYRPAGTLPGGARILLPESPVPESPVPEGAVPEGAVPGTALLLSTSGSSGQPRAVRLSASNVDTNAAAIAAALRLGPGDRAVTSLPLHYCYGLSVLNAHLAAGAAIVLSAAGAPSRQLWRTALDWSVTGLAGVPSTFEALARGSLRLAQLPALRLVTQAGGRLPVDLVTALHREMDRRGGRFVVMYGQTEATARITVLDHDEVGRHPGSVGRPVAGTTVSVEDDQGRALPDGQVGHVIVRGPGVMLGYATGRADLARPGDTGGRLRTGDLGRLDEGRLTLTGRDSRFAKVAGRRVDLDELEELCQGVARAAVVATADERVHICVPGDPGRFATVRQQAARQLGIPVTRLRVLEVAALPCTGSGKVDYPALARLADAPPRTSGADNAGD